MSERKTSWCFTLNNPYVNELEIARSWFDQGSIRGAIWQYERGESGTYHLQGYVQLKRNQGLKWLKDNLHMGAHWEPARGDVDSNERYCSKEEGRIAGPWKCGVFKRQGQRTDIEEVCKAVEDGHTEREIMQNHKQVWFKYHRAIKEYRRVFTSPRSFKSRVIVICGATGTGKSRWCADQFPNAYWKPNGVWWDGYNGESTVIIDDFYGWMSYSFMLRLLDRYPLLVECKGGTHQYVAQTIIITSNKMPNEWYGDKCAYDALERRIDVIMIKEQLEADFIVTKGIMFPNTGIV